MKFCCLITCLILSNFGISQQNYLIVNQDSISVEKFKTDYKLNIENEGIQNAVDSYIQFKLLQQEAEKTKIDTTIRFKNILFANLEPYKKSYLYPDEIKSKLESQIWRNLQVDKFATIYAIGVKNRFSEGELKEKKQLAKDLHNTICKKATPNQSVSEFLGKAEIPHGWYRPFSTLPVFENAIFNTKVGDCSPLHTDDRGLFFVKVEQERPSTGILYIDYIFSKNKKNIDAGFDSLQSGSKWNLVKNKFNEDEGKTGFNQNSFDQNIPEILLEKTVDLNQNNPISNPFEYNDGWYIILLNNHKKFENLEDWSDWIFAKTKQSEYAQEYVTAVENRAEKVVEVKTNKLAKSNIIDAIGSDFFSSNKKINLEKDLPIWIAKNSTFSQSQLLAEYRLAKRFLDSTTNFDTFSKEMMPKIKRQFLLDEYTNNLQDYEPNFAKTRKETSNMILVNYYLDQNIFLKALNDTLGMQNYLQDNKEKYFWPERNYVEVFHYQSTKTEKLVLELLKKNKTTEEILASFKHNEPNNQTLELFVTKEKIPVNSTEFKFLNSKKKYQVGKWKNHNVIFRTIKKLPAEIKTIQEAGKQLQEEYKQYYFEKTLKNLKNQATITIPSTFNQ